VIENKRFVVLKTIGYALNADKMRRGFLIQYLESIVAIIEDKPLFEIPDAIYKGVIFLSFF